MSGRLLRKLRQPGVSYKTELNTCVDSSDCSKNLQVFSVDDKFEAIQLLRKLG